MKRLLFLILALVLAAPGCSMLGLGGEKPKPQLELVNYGLYKNGALAMTTEAAPKKLGTTFGFRFKVLDAGQSGEMSVKTVTLTPGYIDPASNQVVHKTERVDTVKAGETYDCMFTFQYEYEMATGDWTLEVTTKGGQSIKKVFSIYSDKM
ncbi:MAG: DUF3859 domain-containing protein [Desulfovibrionaceae bacterium]|nr:DUF3859 domain-containing protein [Desulfovibrionaceae bacterium]